MSMKFDIRPHNKDGELIARAKTSVGIDASVAAIREKALKAALRAGYPCASVKIYQGDTPIYHWAYDRPTLSFTGALPLTEEPKEEAELPTESAPTPEATSKKPGVIATIKELLKRKEGATIDEMVQVLSQKFPERKPKSMTSTARIQAPKNALKKEVVEDRGTVYYG